MLVWETATWSAGGGNSCGDLKTSAATGSFTAGPNVVSMTDFVATNVGLSLGLESF